MRSPDMIRKAVLMALVALAILSAVLAVVSFWARIDISVSLASQNESVSVDFGPYVRFDLSRGRLGAWYSSSGLVVVYEHWWGTFGYRRSLDGLSVGLNVPMWESVLVFSIYPAVAFVRTRLRHRHRRMHNLCLHCGYNLTGNVTGRCPECGAEVESMPGNPKP
jgi:hypothetical protein